MIMLSVDSAGKSAAVAVTKDEALIAEGFENNGLTHSQTLLPLIEKTLNDAGLTIDDIDVFAVTNGPGSFTGLRIGCALVKGMAGEKPCIAVPTLAALAHNLPLVTSGYIIPMMDARRAQVYTATFKVQDGVLQRCKEDTAQSVDSLRQEIDEYLAAGDEVWLVGDGAYLLQTETGVHIPAGDECLLRGQSVASAAKNIEQVSASCLGLRYLRLSQAEREKKEREEMKHGSNRV